jgi:predicted nucleic acid-binding protein
VLLTSASIRSAAALAQKHALRTYDAVQLALALQANNLLEADDLSLILVSGDSALLQAAQAEGLMTEDPLQHESEQGRS